MTERERMELHNEDRDCLIRIIRVLESDLDIAELRRKIMIGSLIVNVVLISIIIGIST